MAFNFGFEAAGRPVLGVDTGFSFLGWAVVAPGKQKKLLSLGLIQTEKSDKKQRLADSTDNIRRVIELTRAFDAIFQQFPGIGLVTIEAQSLPRNASVTFKLGLAFGAVQAICALRGVALIDCSPQDLKKHMTDAKTATKEAMLEAVSAEYPNAVSLLQGQKLAKGKWEHPIDAVAAADFGAQSNLGKML